jgi:hypothetical protein
MKGGTTAALYNFYHHPDISMPNEDLTKNNKGEIHFFDDDKNYRLGYEWYKKYFNYTKKLVGDKAPDVMYQFDCLYKLQLINPQVKIILLLRNPIDRAFSHYKMIKSDFFPNINSFEYCVNDEIKNRIGENRYYQVSFWYHFIQRGFYYSQIKNILKYFPKENLYIAIAEKIRANMSEEYQKIFDFLGVAHYNTDFKEVYVSKITDIIDRNSKIYKNLKKLYSKDVKKLEKFIGYKTDWW